MQSNHQGNHQGNHRCGKVARRKILIAAVIAALPQLALAATSAQDAPVQDTLPEVEVKSTATLPERASEESKSYTIKKSAGATRLDTSLKETPQSISVVTRQQLDDFRITTINDALDFATGVKVERVETDRTYYTARGSDITNFQVDGIGTPFANGLVFGDIDMASYDRVEILRGANGLLTGTGNPSATINFIRKRPTNQFQAKVDATLGSWDNRRLDADISSPLNADGSVRGRLVVANQNTDSYLDRRSVEKNSIYGIIEADISDDTSVAFGHTYQQNDANSNIWGALPLLYSDGTKRHYKRSDSTAPNWSYWDVDNNNTFAELTHEFKNGWSVKGQLTRKEVTSKARLFYIFGNEDKATGLGLGAQAGEYRDNAQDLIADIYAKGPFEFGGRQHELVVGTSWSRTNSTEQEKFGGLFAFTSFDSIATTPKPTFVASGNFADTQVKRNNSYAAAKFNVTDNLKLTTGASLLSYELEGVSYGVDQNAEANSKVTPYAGVVYDLTKEHALYGSYTGIYNPQIEVDKNLKPLEPLQGKNYEVGIKSELFDKKVNTSFAIFKTVQENVAEQIGVIGTKAIYQGIDANTKGYEMDVAGELTDRLNVSAGYTRLISIKNNSGDNVIPYTPRQLAHVSVVYQVPYIPKLKVGANLNWQSDVHADIGTVRYKQDSYATLNLMANYEIDKHWSTALNLYNVTDEKYLASFKWINYGQGYYAAPLNGSATLTWKY